MDKIKHFLIRCSIFSAIFWPALILMLIVADNYAKNIKLEVLFFMVGAGMLGGFLVLGLRWVMFGGRSK